METKQAESVDINGLTFQIKERKEIPGRKFQWHLYVNKDGRDYLTTQMGSNQFSELVLLRKKDD